MRINARFDEATEKQLQYLTETTGQTVSHVVRESVAQYYVQVKGRQQPSRLVARAGEWNSGHSDTSSNVRAVVLEALKAKYPQHLGGEPAAAAPAKKRAAATPKRGAV
jgi:predicted transcriptional regulator